MKRSGWLVVPPSKSSRCLVPCLTISVRSSRSCSEDAPCRLAQYQVIENPPRELLTDTFMELPRSYYDIFRNRRAVAAPASVWPFVRKKWPVLAEKTDEELALAMGPITEVFVDIRSL